MKRILIAAGGTGGHIFPALVVANQLKNQGVDVHWVGSSRPIEKRLVGPHYPLSCLPMESLRGRGWIGLVRLPWRLFQSVLQCGCLLRRIKPDVVLTMGSFVSAPVGLAAWLLRYPLVVHEQNSIAGMTNQWLSKLSRMTLEAFPSSFPNSTKPVLVGNPVRACFFNASNPKERLQSRKGPLRVFVFGGSQGARALNRVMADCLEHHLSPGCVEVRHQCGEADLADLQQRYLTLEHKTELFAFVDDMVAAYEWADLVVSRSGALSVAEISAVGAASILVPFPFAVDDHQRYNAQFLTDSGGAIMINEQELVPLWLAEKMVYFSQHRDALVALAEQARANAKANATDRVVEILQDVVLMRQKRC